MADIPKFFDQFQPPAEPPQPVLTPPVSKGIEAKRETPGQKPHRIAFTFRDWEFLAYLTEYPSASNGMLADAFGTTLSAASLRVKRLAKMGLLKLAYETWQDEGKVNKRTVEVLHTPDKPWIPEGF